MSAMTHRPAGWPRPACLLPPQRPDPEQRWVREGACQAPQEAEDSTANALLGGRSWKHCCGGGEAEGKLKSVCFQARDSGR